MFVDLQNIKVARKFDFLGLQNVTAPGVLFY